MFYFSEIEIKYFILPARLALRQGLSAAFYDVCQASPLVTLSDSNPCASSVPTRG